MGVFQLPAYDTKLFTEIYETAEEFVLDYKDSGIYSSNTTNRMSDNGATYLFYLLYARYANNPIANYDETQFKYKMWAIMSQYGPEWEKKLEIQDQIRSLTADDEFLQGAKVIYNHAYNPGTTIEQEASSGGILLGINEQNTNNYQKSKMDAYAQLWELLGTDVTEAFLSRFSVCFKQFVRPEHTWIYVTEDEDYER